jgi:malonate-semialdehyde dehydrogenase (acetylating)/methylmalonate-semialdehyde dehydrogenase
MIMATRHVEPQPVATPLPETIHYVAGQPYAGGSTRRLELADPNTGVVRARVALASASDVDHVVQVAARAQSGWADVNPQRRARVLFEYKRLIEANLQQLAEELSAEHGKTVADARGELQRGIDVVEFACGIPHLQKGEFTPGAGPGIDVFSMRVPVGVVVGITPFNFPAMVSMWMFSIAAACGNSVVMKPSEKVPRFVNRLAEIFMEAGAPAGVLNVVHGDKEAVDALLKHPTVKAISFVGSSDIAQYVYATGAAHGKRVQAMGGAKNHGVVMPDADLDKMAQELIGAAFGSGGMRCMALPVVIAVGDGTGDGLRERLLKLAAGVRAGLSTDPDAQYGPLVTHAHYQRVRQYIDLGVAEGAELIIDGRGFKVPGHEEAYVLGPSVFDHVTPEMKSYREEIFGPVLQILRVKTFEEAVQLPSLHQYGNGVAIFTRSGRVAREFAHRVDVGMVGINVPLPVPVAYHSFGGWKRSAYGDMNQHGMEGVRFYTKTKTITQRWPEEGEITDPNSGFVIPRMQ